MIARRTPALLGALALCLLPAACGDDDDSSGAAGTASVAKPKSVNVGLTESGTAVRLKLPKSIKAGPTKLSLTNTGKKPHDMQLVRVAGDQTIEDVLEVVEKEGAPTPKWLSYAGGIGTVAPGKTSATTAVLAPGRYFAADTNSDEKGAAEFRVTGKASNSQLASTPARIETVDYGFEASGLRDGPNEVTFDNTGAEPHHIVAAPIKEGSTIEDVKKFAASDEQSGPPPVDFAKSAATAALDGQNKQILQVDLKRGDYALLCFVSDREGGPPHAQKGMIQEVQVRR